MKRVTKVVIGSVIGLSLVGAVTAKQFGFCEQSPDQRAGWISKRISHKLDLNDMQKAELESLKGVALSAFEAMRGQRPEFSEIEALFATEFDQTKALQLVESRSHDFTTQAPQLITAFADFYNTLDDTQRAEMTEMVEKRFTQGGHGRWASH